MSVAARARPGARLRDARLRLDRQPRQRRRRARGAALGLETYVFIPADLEEQKILATGVYGTNLVKVRGNYDDVNRLCTELSGERDWAFVNVNMRPYYAEGSKTLAYEIAEQLGWRAARPRRRADRLRLAVHEDRQGLRGVARARARRGRRCRAMNGAQADGLLAGRAGLRGGPGLLPPGQARHDRQVAGDRQPGRRPLRARRSRARSGGGIDAVDRRRDPRRASGCSPRRPASSPRPPAASRPRRWPSSPRAATSTPTSASSLVITGDGPQDARRRARHVRRATRSTPPFDQFVEQVEGGVRRLMAVTVKMPDPAARRRRRAGERAGRGRDGRRGARALFASTASCATGSCRTADLRRFVNVYLDGEDIRFARRARDARPRRRASSRSSPPSPAADTDVTNSRCAGVPL